MFRWYQMTWIWPGAIMYHVYDQVPLVPSIWPLATRQVPPWHDSHVKCVAARCRHTRRHIRAPPPVILGMKWISRGAPSHQLDTKCPIISHILDTKYITHQIYLKQCISQKIFSKKNYIKYFRHKIHLALVTQINGSVLLHALRKLGSSATIEFSLMSLNNVKRTISSKWLQSLNFHQNGPLFWERSQILSSFRHPPPPLF